MASDADPYRTLGLTRGASLDDVRSAYRRLAKANHPDRAGEAALPRFLAIQAAYDQIAGPDGGPPPRSGPRSPSRPWSADADRSGATHRAYSGRARRTRASAGPQPGPGSATGDATRSRPDAGPGASRPPGRPPNKATLGSTSYDGVDAEAFEPDWGGASWYGTTSGTYWTLNPKEYADPRKHGPEYQARARRQRNGVAGEPTAGEPTAGEPTADEPAAAEPGVSAGATLGGSTAPDPRTDAPAGGPTHTTASWWEATAGDTTGAPTTEAGATTGGHPRPARTARHGPGASGRPGSPQRPSEPSTADVSTEAVLNALRVWLADGRPGVGGRVGRAVVGWAPIALGIGWLAGEITGCGRFSADCDPAVAPVSWLAQIVTLVVLILVSAAARVATAAAIATLAAVIPGAILLLATHDPGAVNAGRSALGGLMVIAWGTGIAYGLVREARFARSDRGPGGTGPVS